jgi:phosphonate transport system permease protein
MSGTGTRPALAAAGPERPEKPFATARWIGTALVLVAFVWATAGIDIRLARLVELPGTLVAIAGRMFFPPDVSAFDAAWRGMLESIHLAWVGTMIGAALSLPLAFLAATNISGKVSTGIVRQVLNIFRAGPEIIFALCFIPVVGLGPLAGALGIGLSSIGTLGKLSAEAIEGIDPGPVEAVRAAGGNQSQVLRWGVLPQVLPEIVAFWLYRFEINIRAAAILGVVGAGGIGEALYSATLYRRWDRVGMMLIVVVLATIAIDTGSGRIRRRIIGGRLSSAAEVNEPSAAGA